MSNKIFKIIWNDYSIQYIHGKDIVDAFKKAKIRAFRWDDVEQLVEVTDLPADNKVVVIDNEEVELCSNIGMRLSTELKEFAANRQNLGKEYIFEYASIKTSYKLVKIDLFEVIYETMEENV